MAEKVVLSVNTGEAVKNVRELRDNIKYYKDALNDLNATEEENKATLDLLRESQNALKDAMYESAKSTDDLIEQSKDLNVSYNELVHTMAELKSRWRETTDETERANLGQHIDIINSRLKNLDASVGNYSRNVGNYTNSMVEAFTKTAGGASKMITPIKGVTTGLKAMSATPVIAILGLLANIISKIIDALKTSEENTKAVTEAMSIFGAAGDLVTIVLQKLGDVLGKVVKWFSNLFDKLGLVNERMKERRDIAKEEQAILEATREDIYKNADAEKEIAELRAKAADKEKYSASERIQYLEQAADLEKEMAEDNYKLAQREYELIKRKNALTDSSAEDKQKEAEAYAKMVKAETDYFNKQRELSSQLAKTRKEERKAAEDAQKEAQAAQIARLQAEKALVDAELEIVEVGTEEQLKLQKDSVNKQREIDKENAKSKIKNKEELNKTLELLDKKYDMKIEALDKAHNRQRVAEELQFYNNLLAQTEKGTESYYALQIEAKQAVVDSLEKMDNESEAAYQARVIAAQTELKNALVAYDEWVLSEEHQAMQNRMDALQEGSAEYLQAQLELRAYELDTLHQMEGESNEQFRARQIAADKKYKDAKDAILMAQVASMQKYAGAVSGIMGSIADLLESGTEDDLRAAERAKNIRVASATIDTISGAVGAFMQAVKSVPAPYGAILGALEAATVTATGMAQIQKIRATKITTSGSGNSSVGNVVSSSVAAPTIEQAVPQTALVTSAADEEKLNQIGDQRVYILSSDLEANGKRVAVQESESSF
jgi:hypothetical protein